MSQFPPFILCSSMVAQPPENAYLFIYKNRAYINLTFNSKLFWHNASELLKTKYKYRKLYI